jgi:cytoskeletal protein RodZ
VDLSQRARASSLDTSTPLNSPTLGEAVRVGPSESLSFNASGDNWLTVEDQDRLILKSGYVWELAESSVS